jgi:murein DD-endopeptidase MepM/ murein hydrolase activator NlpD
LIGASFAVGHLGAIAQADPTRQHLHHRVRALHRKIAHVRANGPSLANYRRPCSNRLKYLIGARLNLRVHLRGLERYIKHRTDALRTQRNALTAWIQRYGILRTCPVRGQHVVANNFGYIVQKRPGVPRHAHVGNDITAAYGTPIVAPFDGTAVASTNALGGLAVKVYGDAGYAYNAHLSSYGRLGAVTLGDVIGYVGTTGDAGGPHDHFEWHPGDGSAVDPYPYLMAVC